MQNNADAIRKGDTRALQKQHKQLKHRLGIGQGTEMNLLDIVDDADLLRPATKMSKDKRRAADILDEIEKDASLSVRQRSRAKRLCRSQLQSGAHSPTNIGSSELCTLHSRDAHLQSWPFSTIYMDMRKNLLDVFGGQGTVLLLVHGIGSSACHEYWCQPNCCTKSSTTAETGVCEDLFTYLL